MNEMPSITKAVSNGEVVITCVYHGHVPEDVLAQLPDGFESRQYVLKLVDGKLVDMRKGMPEQVIGALLPTPVDRSIAKTCSGCPPNSEGEPCQDCETKPVADLDSESAP